MRLTVANQGFPLSPQSSLPPQVKELVLNQGFLMRKMTLLKRRLFLNADDEDDETESDTNEIYKYKIHVHKDVDVEMAEPETVEREKEEKEEMTDAAKPDVEKSEEEEGDAEKAAGSSFLVKEATKFPLPYSSLSVSFGFETTNLPPIQEILTETPVSNVVSLPRVTPIISTVQQTTTPISTPPISTDAPTITTVVPESDALSVVQLRVAKLEKDVSGLKNIDLSAEALVALKTQVPSVVDNYLGSKVRDVFQKELKKYTTYLIQKYYLQ
ncbi:hypothetical protein Tco_0216470 [Tanacetum coccineum]